MRPRNQKSAAMVCDALPAKMLLKTRITKMQQRVAWVLAPVTFVFSRQRRSTAVDQQAKGSRDWRGLRIWLLGGRGGSGAKIRGADK